MRGEHRGLLSPNRHAPWDQAPASGSVPGPDDEQLANLLAELAERYERGEMSELGDFKQLAEQDAYALQQLMPTVEQLLDLGKSDAESSLSTPILPEVGTMLGDFRLLREIGRGGMGVVFEAEQLSLQRRVAVKVLPRSAALDERLRERFRREAQAVASLRHPNLVPVYAIGIEPDAHYYAMQLIDGIPLTKLIAQYRQGQGQVGVETSLLLAGNQGTAERPVDPAAETCQPPSAATSRWLPVRGTPEYYRLVAWVGQQAAEGLEHAHQQGVIHRDIKPANLLIDTTPQVWVTDFGLAALPQSDELTLTGDLLGTVRYMSPEQAAGRRGLVDQRTDLYSLGLTLYEMLALEPAFKGERGEILRQIETVEPTSLRQLDPRIPRDLATIVEKAIQKLPADRYHSARALADDLECFQTGRPILARPLARWERLRRWIQRQRLLLLGVTGGALLVAMVACGAWWYAEKAREREQAERRKALAHVVEQHAIVRSTLVKFASADEIQDPAFEAMRQDFFGKATDYLERFRNDWNEEPALASEMACTFAQLAYLHQQRGQLEVAIPLYQDSLEAYDRLIAQSVFEPLRAGFRDERAKVADALADCLANLQRP